MQKLTDEEEDLIFEIEPILLSIGTITFSEKIVSLLSVGVSEIKSTKEFDSKQRTSNQITTQVVFSIVKSKDFCVRPKVTIVVVPKKNGKLKICVDFKKLNKATKKDHYPLPFFNEVLNIIARYEVYSFLDGYSRYVTHSQLLEGLKCESK